MFYLQDLGAHELHGPFVSRYTAYLYAKRIGISAYRVLTDMQAQNQHDPGSVRLVPHECR